VQAESGAAGTYASFNLLNNSGFAGIFAVNGSTYTDGIFPPGSAYLTAYQSGGLSLNAIHASGEIRLVTGGYAAGNIRLRVTSAGLLNYEADKSASYTDRSVVDKGYVDSRVALGNYAGEDVTLITASYTVPTTSKIINILFSGATGQTITLPTGSTADKMVIYFHNATTNTVTFSQTIWESSAVSYTSIANGQLIKLIYKNADSKWYGILID
jgi:hypothetical protein